MGMQKMRSKSLTTKVSEEEYMGLEVVAHSQGKNMSEWARDQLLSTDSKSNMDRLLGEVLALRMLMLNILAPIAKGETITPERIRELIQTADREKQLWASELKKGAA
jgi:hypothetical protein